jgi:hypothetical protein
MREEAVCGLFGISKLPKIGISIWDGAKIIGKTGWGNDIGKLEL